MISSMLAMMLAATSAQATDTTRAAREGFTACLRSYVNRSIEGGMTQEVFDREYPQQCTAQQTAYREAIVRRETALRATRANADEQANLEIEDARVNFSDRFEPPQGQAQAQTPAQPQAQAQAQTPAQPQ